MKRYSIEKITTILIILLGIIISSVQFINNRSLWQDEAALALNIINRNSCELLKPLDYVQVAPILFLQIEKLFSTIWPNSEYGLRLFPLLCFWASIFFFYKIIKRLSDNIYARIVALSFFCMGYMLVYYSSEVKQYMSDVFIFLCISYCVIREYRKERNKYWLSGIIGIIAVFLSNVAPVILFTCGLYLVSDCFVQKKKITPLLAVFSTWLSAFLLYYYFFIYEHPLQNIMVKYWYNVNAFLPLNPFSGDFYKFLIQTIPTRIFTTLFFDYNESIGIRRLVVFSMILLFIAGLVKLVWSRRIKIVILACTPILLHLFLSAFQLYPFERRLILYTIPGMIIVCSIGFGYILNIISFKLQIEKFRYFVVIVVMLLICLPSFARFPSKHIEVKDGIKYIQENMEKSKSIYSFLFASQIFQYYKEIGFVSNEVNIISDKKVKLTDIGYYMVENGEYLHSDQYINYLKTQLHNKVWLLLHAINDNEKYIINKLDSLGYNKIEEFRTKGSSVYLYDFGE
jgi:hypothetical protein